MLRLVVAVAFLSVLACGLPMRKMRKNEGALLSQEEKELHKAMFNAVLADCEALWTAAGPTADDFGQLHEVYSAKDALTTYGQDDGDAPGVVTAGLAVIAGTLSGGKWGSNGNRAKVIHTGLGILLPNDYKDGGKYTKVFGYMGGLATADDNENWSKVVGSLTLLEWFQSAHVGDFAYLFFEGGICAGWDCFGEFWKYGGLDRASKKGVPIKDDATCPPGEGDEGFAKESCSFWHGQQFFIEVILKGPFWKALGLKFTDAAFPAAGTGIKAGFSGHTTIEDSNAMKADVNCHKEDMSGCATFTEKCAFDTATGIWHRKKVGDTEITAEIIAGKVPDASLAKKFPYHAGVHENVFGEGVAMVVRSKMKRTAEGADANWGQADDETIAATLMTDGDGTTVAGDDKLVIDNFAKKHDSGYNEAVVANGYQTGEVWDTANAGKPLHPQLAHPGGNEGAEGGSGEGFVQLKTGYEQVKDQGGEEEE